MLKKNILRPFAILCWLFFFSFLKTYSCDQTSINVLTAVDNGNGTFTYTVQVCLGISPNWGGTDAITLDADVPIINSGFTSSITTTYNYCNQPLSCNNANCLTANGMVMGCPPAGGSITNVTATASGSVGGGNLTYNGTNDLSPGDVDAPAGDCNDCNNPNQLCFNITFITTGAMTTVQLNGAEQDNNNCGGGTCCPNEIDTSVPVPVSGCTPPTASFTSNSPGCIGEAFDFTNTGTMTSVTWSWSFPSGSPSSSTSQSPTGVTWSAAGSYTVVQTVCLTAQPTCCSNFSQTIEVNAPPTLSGTGAATSCGLCNGSADLGVTGGDAPYSYNWSNGATSQDLSALCSGSYTVTVTDNAGCISTRTFTVATSTGPTCAISVTGSTCLVGNSFNFDYTGTTNCSMGNSPVISWSFPGGTPASSTSDPANGITYSTTGTKTATLSVTDCGSPTCTVTCSTTVTVNPSPTLTLTPTAETCVGLCNGSATAAGSGTTSPYTYAWSGGLGSGATKSGLCAGTYTVTVTDASGCTNINTVTINPGLAVTSTFTSSANQCLTGNSFSFTNTGTTGTYSWTFPSGTPASSTTNNPTGVTWSTAGTYTITHNVIQSGCTSTTTGTITVYAQPTVSITPVNPNCNTGCTGSVTAAGAGGTPGYTYTWSGGLGAGATKSSLCAGSYTVTVTDANGCTGTATATLTAPPVLTVTATATPASCNGTCNGTLSASGGGGTSPYTYSWSGGLGAGATKSGVCDGTYTVTITDNKGCTTTATATVTEPAAIVPTASSTNATCNGTCNGSVSVSATGGTSPYSYVWSGGLGMGSPISSVCDGVYTVTVTDNAGCTITTTATVTEPPALTVSPTGTNPTCNGLCNGTVSASGAGGVSPYSYLWSGGLGMGSPVSGVCAGTYTVTVTDANSCTKTGTVTLTAPAALTVTATPVAATCNGTCNGTLTAAGSGGTTAYTYSWSSGLGTGATKSSVCAGTYTVTVTDANGCTATATATVNQPTLLVASATGVNPSCNGGCNGTLTGSASGGTTGYTYSWSGGLGSGATKSGVCAGTYTVTVTDANGCTKTASFTLTAPTALTATATPGPATCFGTCNGTLTAAGSGGTTGYTYSWSGGLGSGASKTGVCAGTYTVTVTDANGCTTTATATVTQPTAVSGTVTPTAATCNGTCNGALTAAGSGGTSPYTYSWSGGLGSGASKTGVCDGTYTVTITDASGCIGTASGTVTEPSALSVSTTPTAATCNGTCNGSISATGAGGTTGYTYLWSGGLGMGSPVSSVCAGTYTVTVTDANGCTATATATVNQPTLLVASATGVNPSCNGGCNGTLTGSASGGTTGYSYSWSGGLGSGATKSGVCAGTYTVTVTDANGCTKTASFTLTAPTALTATATPGPATCFGTCNGTLTAAGSGGTTGYTYSWSSGLGSGASKTGVCAGPYTVTVTDANSCTTTATATVTQPTAVSGTVTPTAATCNGTCNGALTAAGSGGSSPYTYSWSGGLGSGASKTGVCDGTYTVTITDASGCVGTASGTVTEPSALSVSTTPTAATCNGTCNGSISATGAGGTTGYTYLWSGGLGMGSPVSSVCAGTYTVTVTDANGCTATNTATVTQPTVLVASATGTNPACNGSCNGTLTGSGSAGTSPYTYVWSGGLGSGATKSGVCAGTYTVTVADANGCTKTASFTLTAPTALTATATPGPATCFGTCNGTLTAAGSGGTTGYTYSWSGGLGSGASKTGVCAGTYTVTVTDANSCTTTATATVTQPTALTATATGTNVNCNGGNNGTASVSGSGGTGSYTYLWSNAATAASISGLTAGTYNVTVTDANSCTATASYTVTQPTALSSTASGTNATCNGVCNGTATASPSGGTTAYTYAWGAGSGFQTTISATGLCAGSYTVTVTDNKGCTTTASYTVTQPTAIVLVPSSVPATCGANNGTASVSASGGTAPYTYNWSSTPAQTTASATGLAAGGYTVTVTDNNGCTATAVSTVNSVGGPTVTIPTSANVSCNGGNNGSATTSVVGGTTPYTYSWSPSGGTGASATGLTAGTYTVNVTDFNSCIASASITITQPVILTSSITTSTNITCNGLCNGNATVTASGGTTNYTYLWPVSASSQTTATATGLCVGSFIVTVTDANSCTSTASATITQPTALTASATATATLCNSGCNGATNLTAGGGTTPYTYSWSNAATSEDLTGLCAGSFSVTVTDANSCTATAPATVNEPTALSLSTSTANSTCGNSNGSATVTASGGTTGYTYQWSNAQTTATATGVAAGTYNVTVTDANGCTATTSATVSNSGGPTVTIPTSTNVSCFGGSNGSATSSVSGGATPYTFVWAPSGGTAISATGLIAGTYTVTVTDANSCTATANITITQPTTLSSLISASTNITCNGLCNGNATVTASGGTTNYSYLWPASAGSQITATATGLCVGSFIVTVTDANGCNTQATATISQPTALTATTAATAALCNGSCNGSVNLTPSGGTTSYSYSWSNAAATEDITTLCTGSYSVTVTDANGCNVIATATVNEPTAISLTTSSANATCGNSNGTATVSASGGTTGYTYLWENAQTAATATGVAAGNYNVTVTDANGCTATTTATVNNASAPTVTIPTSTNVSCFGGNNGSATASVSGGVTPYTFIWAPTGGTAISATGLIAGTYTVTVTDANSCTATANITITQPTTLSSLISSSTNITCNGLCNGNATVTASGGTTNYSYLWPASAGSQITATATGLCVGSFIVTVTDANGCNTQVTATISQPTALAATTTATAALCNGSCNGSVNLTPSGGTTSYSYSWSNAAVTEDITALCAGSYSVTVTDANGCIVIATATINEPTAISLSTFSANATCGNSNGTATVSASGGTTGYTYLWENAQTASTATGVAAGNYNVTVTDANGCTATTTATVNNASAPTVTIINVINVSCFGGNNGSAEASVSSGVSPYTYLWAPSGGTGTVASGLSSGNYSVTVADANGCTAIANTTITQPGVLGALISSSSNISCNGLCDGSATVAASGGTSPYSYFWQGGGATATKTALCAGTFNVTVSDANSCATIATVTITQPPALTTSIAGTDILCNGICNGTANLTVNGGIAPYIYSWSNSGTSEDISSLCSGNFNVTVTDNNGCISNSSVTIAQPTAISLSTSSVNSNCGQADGQTCVSATGGMTSYTYLWDSFAGSQTTTCATGVAAGSYSVTVTDANGCISITTVSVSDASGGTASATINTNASGAGICDGSATASMTGGTSPFTYLWGNGQTTLTSTGLCAGTQCVTITDANLCSSVACIIITEPGAIILSTVVTNVTCNGICDGSIDLSVSGGVSPFTYQWSSGATAQDPANLCAGTYSVTVTDNNGITAITSAAVTEPSTISISGITTDLICNGLCTGSINITASGGISPYIYSWSNSSSIEDISSLCAGSYTVTVADANSCTANSIFSISQPIAITLSTSSTNASCGNANGSASVSPSGGTSPYTYNWSAGSMGATQSSVSAGSYDVTVTDANGCTANATVSVSNNSTGTASAAVVNNVLCNGGSSGQASASITGGLSPFTYLWSNGDTGIIADSLSAGTYNVSITDVNGCVATANIFITQPSIIDASAGGTAATCNGFCNGTLSSGASGGTSPYTFTWSGGLGNGSNISNVCAGSYFVTATDNNGCTASVSFTVNQPTAISPVTATVNSTCGQADGQATVTATGGTSPYTYLWNDVDNSSSSTVTGIPAGTYTVTVTDGANCTATTTATVNDNSAPVATVSESAPITCNGICDGGATLSVAGGTSPYTYLWSNGDSGVSADSLCVGTSSVNITDATGCVASATVTLNEPAVLSLALSGNDVNCNGGNDGDATVSASGGTSPYSYLWSDFSISPVNDSLIAGTYSVSATDANGCEAASSFTVNQPTALSATANASPVLCNGGNTGSATATATGGISPYSYLWDNAGTLSQITNLNSQIYSVTITDANGCSTSDTALVTEPLALNSFASATNIFCNGDCNGSVADSASGGTLPYSFTWSGGLGSGANQNNVCAGAYSVTVSDGNGCVSVQNTTVSAPTALANLMSQTNVSCNGNCDGTATASISGGTSPYSFLWDNTNFDTTSSVNSLCAGTFNVSITDANGCTISGNATITQPVPFVLGNSTNGSTCGQADGSGTVTIVSGGVTPYSYQWSATANNQTTATATGLAAGCYNITVTNGNGCTAIDNICVSDLGAPTVSLLTKTNSSCFGSCDGFAQIAVSGGNPPYTYTWYDSIMTSIGQATASAFNLCSGTYIGSMVDSTGCTGSISVIISQPAIVSGIISSSDSVSCFGNCDGQATAAGSGGTSPFSYQWNDLLSQTSANATGLCPGTYDVIISDVNSCDTTILVIIGEPVPVSLAINTTNAFCGTPSGQACATVTDGVSPFTYLWNDGQTTQCAGNLVPGNYSVTVTDFNGCTAGATGTVNNTAAGTASISNLINVSCNGNCNGSATVSMSGSGTTPFTYLWSNGSDSVTSTGLCAGTITVTVTDAQLCVSTATSTITQPLPLATTTSVIDALCNGVCSGTATVTATGGISPFNYLWNDILAQTTETATGLCSGNYSVTITDVNNCLIIANDIVGQPTALQLSSTVFDANCGQPNGNACVAVSGGTSPYNYLWAGGETNQCLNNVTSGNYDITVTDANGCSGNLGVSIQDLNGPVVSISSVVNITCNGNCNGSATINMSGGAGSYVIAWFDNAGNPIFQTNPTAANLCAGTYSATVTDSAGCSASVSVTINEPSAITFNQSSVNPTCSGACSGSGAVSVTGGTSPYTYLWNDSQNQTTATSTGLCAGNYNLTIADTNSCTVFANFTLTNPTVMTASTSVTSTTCSGVCNGNSTVNVFNGNMPFTYQWDSASGNQTTQQAINLCGGTYNVTVTDATGCSATTSATISQPPSVNAVITTFGNISCNGDCDGFAQASVSGGTPGYVYSWSDGQINQVASNLCAGVFEVTIMDVNGCSDTAQVIINEPQAMSSSINKTNVTCNGNCDGSATLNATGGMLPYTYLWSASAGFQNTASATGLCAGTHSVTVTDVNGCSKSSSTNIIQPTPFGMAVTYFANANCGQNNGQICVNATGGTAPYSYQWNDPFTQTSSCADSLYTGCYNINITDASGCTADSVVCINDVAGPTIVLVNSDSVNCAGNANGLVEFSVSGGVGPYTSQWFDNSGNLLPAFNNLNIANGLIGGTYTIEIADAAGCISSASEFVYEPNPMVAAITSTIQNNCFGQCLGQATASVAGGTLPYSYQWDNPANFQTSPTATGLCSGTYFVTISDINTCSKILNVTITEPDSIVLASIISNTSCNDSCDGFVSVNVTGGSVPYFYSWSPNNSVNPSAFALCAGTYNTTITDANGCIASTNNTITEPPAITAIYSTVDATCGSCNGQGTLSVSGGTPNYAYQWFNGQNDTTATGLCAGINAVTITDSNGCNINVGVNLLNIGGPVIDSIVGVPPNCTGYGDGEAAVFVSGGTPNYSFQWNDSMQTQNDSINSLNGGNYFVTVTDANGCFVVLGVNITEPTPMQAIGSPGVVICYGQSTQIWTTGSGGSGSYSYQWAGEPWFTSGPHTVNPTTTADYCFTVMDDFGCTDTGCITVTVKPQLSVFAQNGIDTVNICFKEDTANLCAVASGGNDSLYTFTWSNNFIEDSVSSSCQQVNPLSNLTYFVIADDGCSLNDTDTVVVMVRDIPIASFVTVPFKGCPPFVSDFTSVNPGANIANPTYSWDFNGDGVFDDTMQFPKPVYTDPGTYTVSLIVTSEFGCKDTFSIDNYIIVDPVPTAGVDHSPEIGSLINPDIQFTTDGLTVGATSWAWEFGDDQSGTGANPLHIYEDTGTYYVTLIVTNDEGCKDTIQDTVIINSEFVIFVPNAFTPNGNGKNEFFAAQGVGIDLDNYVMYIFDRWGDLIFETHDLYKGWDGKAHNGAEMVQQDVYVWLIICYDLHGNKHRLIGHVTVVK